MEPPAYTGGHVTCDGLAGRRHMPAMEPPAYTGGHVSDQIKRIANHRARNGASGLHRRTRLLNREPSGKDIYNSIASVNVP